jgi:hypothetical protein
MVKKVVTTEENSEIEMLKSQLVAMQKALEKLQPSKEETDEEDITISGDKYIKVISLCPTVLNLTTQLHGKGKVFTFLEYGDVKRILYRDLVDIMEAHDNFLKQGYYAILNRDVVRKHGLDEVYAKILTKENIDNIILGKNESDAVNLFKSANEQQKDFIVRILIDKMLLGVIIDLNFLDRLSREVDFNIYERFQEMKSYQDMNKPKE